MWVKDDNKTVLITYLEMDGEVLLKSRMRENFTSGSVRELIVTSGLLLQQEVRYEPHRQLRRCYIKLCFRNYWKTILVIDVRSGVYITLAKVTFTMYVLFAPSFQKYLGNVGEMDECNNHCKQVD